MKRYLSNAQSLENKDKYQLKSIEMTNVDHVERIARDDAKCQGHKFPLYHVISVGT